MSKTIEDALRACKDQYVMLQPRPGMAFNIPTVQPADGVSWDEDHPFPATTSHTDERGQRGQAMIQLPILMGKVVERLGAIWLRVFDEASNSGRYILVAVDPDVIVAVSVLADVNEDEPKKIAPPAPPAEKPRIVLAGS